MQPIRAGRWHTHGLALLWSIAGLLVSQKWVTQRPAARPAQFIMHIVASAHNL